MAPLVETCSIYIYIYICYKWSITQYVLWMIYWLFFNLALFHCTIKVTTHKYRSTAGHGVSIPHPFCASYCPLFDSSVCVCYVWEWEMWRVYWLCWIEIGHMWISILWTLCGLFNWHLLGHSCGQREDSLKIAPIGSIAVGCSIDIPADEYTAKWTAQTNAVTRPLLWPWHL